MVNNDVPTKLKAPLVPTQSRQPLLASKKLPLTVILWSESTQAYAAIEVDADPVVVMVTSPPFKCRVPSGPTPGLELT